MKQLYKFIRRKFKTLIAIGAATTAVAVFTCHAFIAQGTFYTPAFGQIATNSLTSSSSTNNALNGINGQIERIIIRYPYSAVGTNGSPGVSVTGVSTGTVQLIDTDGTILLSTNLANAAGAFSTVVYDYTKLQTNTVIVGVVTNISVTRQQEQFTSQPSLVVSNANVLQGTVTNLNLIAQGQITYSTLP